MTAKRMHFTELALSRLSTEGLYWDTHTRAFGLRVGKRKKTLFIVRGDGSREIVGHYPHIDLKTARKKAQLLLLSAPQDLSDTTFLDAFESYKATYLHNYRERSRKEVIRLIEKHCRHLLTSKVSRLTQADIRRTWSDLSPSEANHLFGVLRTFFTWAEKRDLCTSPLRKLDKPFKEKSRDRILTDDEIRKIWSACDTTHHHDCLVKLALLTGQRRGELTAIQPDWIDGNWLTFPEHITKNATNHSIWLSDTCKNLTPYLRASYSAWGKSKAALDHKSNTAGWTIHDLRRTWASLAARWGIPEHLAARIQNHKTAIHTNPIRAVYQRYEFRDEIRDAMELFERRLLDLLQDAAGHTSS